MARPDFARPWHKAGRGKQTDAQLATVGALLRQTNESVSVRLEAGETDAELKLGAATFSMGADGKLTPLDDSAVVRMTVAQYYGIAEDLENLPDDTEIDLIEVGDVPSSGTVARSIPQRPATAVHQGGGTR